MKCMFKTIWPVMCWLFVLCMTNSTKLNAQVWTDSLHIRIVNPNMQTTGSVVTLKFDVEVFRPNTDWNQTVMKRDTSLGFADFYFGKVGMDLETIFGAATVTPSSPLIGSGAGAALEMTYRFALGQFHIALRPVSGSAVFPLPHRKWVPICKVSLPLIDPTTVDLGVVWNEVSTACITRENSPIIKTLIGDVDSRPDSILQIVDWTNKQNGGKIKACEGSDLILAVKAFSTREGTTFEWRDSVPGKPWDSLGKRNIPQGRKTHPVFKYDYELIGKGDTLIIYNAPASIDTAYFKCVVENLNMPVDDRVRTSGTMSLDLNDKLHAALTSLAGNQILKSRDSIFYCPGNKASFGVAFYNVSDKVEFMMREKTSAVIGNIHVKYNYITAHGGMGTDTLTFPAGSWVFGSAAPTVMYCTRPDATVVVKEDGKYWVDKVWTDSCVFGEAMSKYDTVVIRQRAKVNYELNDLTVDINDDISLMQGVSFDFDNITYMLDGSGSPKFGMPTKNPVTNEWRYYANNTPGTDTIHYIKRDQSGCDLDVKRLVYVNSNKYLTIKVLLEGPYNKNADTMFCMWKNYFPNTVNDYKSPYADSLKITMKKPFPNYGKAVCDWIYVELWDYPPYGATVGDTRRGVKVDSTSALLLSDGTVAGLDGKKYLTFTKLQSDKYYVLVKHRNHLSVISAEAKQLSSTIPSPTTPVILDFAHLLTSALDKRPGIGNKPLYDNENGRYFMYAGDMNKDNLIGVVDNTIVLEYTGKPSDYWTADLNLDGSVNTVDYEYCEKNASVTAKY